MGLPLGLRCLAPQASSSKGYLKHPRLPEAWATSTGVFPARFVPPQSRPTAAHRVVDFWAGSPTSEFLHSSHVHPLALSSTQRISSPPPPSATAKDRQNGSNKKVSVVIYYFFFHSSSEKFSCTAQPSYALLRCRELPWSREMDMEASARRDFDPISSRQSHLIFLPLCLWLFFSFPSTYVTRQRHSVFWPPPDLRTFGDFQLSSDQRASKPTIFRAFLPSRTVARRNRNDNFSPQLSSDNQATKPRTALSLHSRTVAWRANNFYPSCVQLCEFTNVLTE